MATLTVSAEDEKRVKGLGFLSNKGTDNFSARVITVNGKVTARQLRCVSEAAEKFGNGNVTFTTRMTMEVQGIPFEKIEDFRAYIAREGLETGGTGPKVRPVVSCKGTTCQYGLIDTFGLSEKIHNRFYKGYRQVKLPHKFKIGVGGCPNSCVKPNLNDLGIVGQRLVEVNLDQCKGCKKCKIEAGCPMKAAKVVDGKIFIDPAVCNHCGRCAEKCPFGAFSTYIQGYRVYIGGRWGKLTAAGRPMSKIFTSEEEVLSVVEKCILLFRDQGLAGERFATTIERLGFENAEAQLLGNDLLERKQEILAKE